MVFPAPPLPLQRYQLGPEYLAAIWTASPRRGRCGQICMFLGEICSLSCKINKTIYTISVICVPVLIFCYYSSRVKVKALSLPTCFCLYSYISPTFPPHSPELILCGDLLAVEKVVPIRPTNSRSISRCHCSGESGTDCWAGEKTPQKHGTTRRSSYRASPDSSSHPPPPTTVWNPRLCNFSKSQKFPKFHSFSQKIDVLMVKL